MGAPNSWQSVHLLLYIRFHISQLVLLCYHADSVVCMDEDLRLGAQMDPHWCDTDPGTFQFRVFHGCDFLNRFVSILVKSSVQCSSRWYGRVHGMLVAQWWLIFLLLWQRKLISFLFPCFTETFFGHMPYALWLTFLLVPREFKWLPNFRWFCATFTSSKVQLWQVSNSCVPIRNEMIEACSLSAHSACHVTGSGFTLRSLGCKWSLRAAYFAGSMVKNDKAITWFYYETT